MSRDLRWEINKKKYVITRFIVIQTKSRGIELHPFGGHDRRRRGIEITKKSMLPDAVLHDQTVKPLAGHS